MIVTGLTPDEVRWFHAIAQAASPHEMVILRLATAMAKEGEPSGARWLVRKVIAHRRAGR